MKHEEKTKTGMKTEMPSLAIPAEHRESIVGLLAETILRLVEQSDEQPEGMEEKSHE